MDIKETLSKTLLEETILKNDEYYKYIFKKTEKMACAVFYIMRSGDPIGHIDSVVVELEQSAKKLLNSSLKSLRSTQGTIEDNSMKVVFALIEFESMLRIANSARLLGTDLLEVFIHEIDSVRRSLKKFSEPTVTNPLMASGIQSESVRRHRSARAKNEMGSLPSGETQAHLQSRRDRVLNVLRDKGEATIKDIREFITDCSEKTIQRELISLIKDTIIVREGERRWSKYKLI